MKIVYIFRSIAVKGGAERVLVDKMNYLAEVPGYELFLITYEQAEHPMAYPLSPKVHHIDLGLPFFRAYKYGFIRRRWMHFKLGRIFRRCLPQQIIEIDPDITICTSYMPRELFVLTQMKDRSKKIIESHSAKLAIARKAQHPKKGILRLLAGILDKKFYRDISKFDAFITLTKADALAWKSIKEAQVITNMLTYYPSEITDKFTSKRVISAGRLTKQKGYDLLLQTWQIVNQKHPDWRLDIYGEGEDKNVLLKEIEKLHLDQSVCIHQPTTRIYDRFMESDFYVMSSRWEGFGLVLSEAMSCGIPCVSFNCPHGPSDIIEDGEDGLLVEDGNITQLAEKICFMIENEDIRQEMGRKARENVKRYLPENIMPQWEALFNQLLKQ